jgi:hypothetical protein
VAETERRIKLASVYYYPLRDPAKGQYVMEMADGVVGRDRLAEALRGIADNIDRTMATAAPTVEVEL